MKVEIVHLGCAGHFICADSCRYRRNTEIHGSDGTGYRVSTVGDMYLAMPGEDAKRMQVGAGENAWFETYVFPIERPSTVLDNDGCGCWQVTEWQELNGSCRSATAGQAHEAHEILVRSFAARKRKELA